MATNFVDMSLFTELDFAVFTEGQTEGKNN